MHDGKPSFTAVGVALARSALDRPATPTGDPGAEAALVQSLLADVPPDVRDDGRRRAERLAPNGFIAFLVARTTFFDDAVLRAIDRGADQVVIVGAGYDLRSARFRSPGVRFFEVDHPATQRDKRQRLQRLDVATDDITFVEADFTKPGLTDALLAAGHRRDRPSLFVLEGVLRYLPPEWFRGLLAAIAECAIRDSELAVSISTQLGDETSDAALDRRRHERRLAESGEPVLTVPPKDVALEWLTAAGWCVDEQLDVDGREGHMLIRAHPS
jgi:methyltransferase (TIGR00027 family)